MKLIPPTCCCAPPEELFNLQCPNKIRTFGLQRSKPARLDSSMTYHLVEKPAEPSPLGLELRRRESRRPKSALLNPE
jgi:hypothetical protein